MKILFINHKDIEGGAAVAAYRLHRGLSKYHETRNSFIVSKKYSGAANVFTPWDHRGETSVELCRFIEFMTDRILNKFGFQYYSFPFSTPFILKKARDIQPDIISLHNIHGGYFKTSLIKKLSAIAPVVWTLHDMWAFTSNAAHTFGDQSWKEMKPGKDEKRIYPHTGRSRGGKLLKRKKKIYAKSNLHAVAPSHWLHDLAGQAPVLENIPLHHITHGLDLDIFKPLDKTACRKALRIPANAKVIMFSSADDLSKSAWKGGPLLLDILKTLDKQTKTPIHALVLGKGNLDALGDLKNLIVHHMGYIHGENFFPTLYSAADLLIYPTKADNLSLVLIEAIACGLPVVTFQIGGNIDIIRDSQNGFLVPPFDVDMFVDKSLHILEDSPVREDFSKAARQIARENFSLETMASGYYKLFQEVARS